MTERNSKSDVLKKLSDGKTLCSEMNNASSNANFLFMRRHDAMVVQLESAKQSLVSQNQRAQNEMKKKLEKYRMRKRTIFRNRVVSHQSDEQEDSEHTTSIRPTTSGTRSSIGDRSSMSANSGNSSLRLPSILSMSLVSGSDGSFSPDFNKHHKFHRMKRQENLHYQVLSSRVYDFCSMLDSERQGTNAFFITTAKRRIAFSDSRARSRVSSGVTNPGSRVSSSNITGKGILFRERQRVTTALTN